MAFELIFRPNNGYFLTTPTGWSWSANLPANISTRLLKTKKDESNLDILHHLALDPEGNYFMSWKDATGKTWTDHTLSTTHPDLVAWIKESNGSGHEGPSYRISLNSNGQFFARGKKGEMCNLKWGKAPTALESTIQEMMTDGKWKDGQTPSSISFGVEGTWVLSCAGGKQIKWSGNITEFYPGFHKEVIEKFGKGRSYEFLTLNPYTRDQYLAVWDDGSSGWQVPTSFSTAVKDAANEFSKRRDEKLKAEIALLDQATRLAEAQMRRNVETQDAMGCIGTGTTYRYAHGYKPGMGYGYWYGSYDSNVNRLSWY